MASERLFVSGNLACAPLDAGRAARSAGLRTVDGPVRRLAVSREPEAFASCAHAQLTAKPQTRAHALATGALTCLLALSLALCAVAVLGAREAVRTGLVEAAQTALVTVDEGDSLWSIAVSHEIEGLSTAETVEAIKEWNDLSTSTLQPGMSLVVPASN